LRVRADHVALILYAATRDITAELLTFLQGFGNIGEVDYRDLRFSSVDTNCIQRLSVETYRRTLRRIFNPTVVDLLGSVEAVHFTLGLGRRQIRRTPILLSCIPVTSIGRVKFRETYKGAITSKIKRAIKHKTSPAQDLHNCCSRH